MITYKRISMVLYLIAAGITLSMGTKFLSATEYFVYHAEASGIDWVAVHPGLQIVFRAIFKVCGAGFVTVSLAMLAMIIIPFGKYGHRWSFYAIPFVGMVFWSIILTATLYVSYATNANTPWSGSLMCIGMLIAAFLLSMLYQSRQT